MPPLQPAEIQAKLDSSRRELLDLTFRNPLLNFRPLKARGVEAVEARPESIYPLLVMSGRKFTFAPAPPRAEAEKTVAIPVAAVFAEVPVVVEDVASVSETAGTMAESAAAPVSFDDFFRKLDDPNAAEEANSEGDSAPSVTAELEAVFADAAAESASAEVAPIGTKHRAEPAATTLQTACTPAELQQRLLNTMHTARTFVEEQGVNTLFLALGMLTWTEQGTVGDAAGGGAHRSPLLLVPVELERAAAGERFTLRYTEEDITGNVSLATYLQQNFGLELPPLPEREDLDVAVYLEQIGLIVGGRSGWSVDTSAVALAFFTFNKFLMYKELEDAAWPENQGPSRHPVLTALLGGGFHEAEPLLGEDDYLDKVLPPSDTNTVVEADGSQVLAIEDVKQGCNLVIQGPPGTGKSQSITNIIAEALGQNKTVLFVSEKMAALEVVKRRLDSVGLGDACLELHSNKTNKKAILEELKRTLSLGKPVESRTAGDDMQLLVASRDRLNAYCDAVNAPVGASGWTPHTLYGEWLRLQTTLLGVDLPRVPLPESHVGWTSLDFRQREQAVTELQAQIASMGGPPVDHPFWGSARSTYVSTDADLFRTTFTEARDSTVSLRATAERLAVKLSLPAPATVGEADALAAAAQRAIAAPEHGGMQFSSGQWLARRADLAELLRLGGHMAELKQSHGNSLAPEAWDTDVRETRQAIAEQGGKWFKFVLGDWRQAQKAIRVLCVSTPPQEPSAQVALLDAILEYRRTKAAFTEQAALGAMLFGAQWQGERSDWPVLAQLLQWIVSVHEAVGDGLLPRAFIDFLSGSTDLKALTPEVGAVQSAIAAYRTHTQQAVERLDFREEARFGANNPLADQPLVAQEAMFGSWVSEIGRLQQIAAFNHLAARCRILDLVGIVETATTAERGQDLLVIAFQRAYYQALLRQVFGENPELANFNGAVHGQTADQFRVLDARLLEHNRIELATQHWQAVAKLKGLLGQIGEGQLRVLTREFEKKSRHLPIRQLVEKAGHAVQAIKPVFMMSPLSVATFLAPGHLKFDLVVFDEASQVKPVDALGALARGAQAVVVGDSKQLPPTSFFESLAQSDGAIDEDNETADMESVLGLFVGQGAPQRMLKWHYRSRHESLIAVSNQEFYDNKLVIFPSPDAAREQLGLAYRYLPDTVYDRGTSGTNRAEAKAVAEAALAHARIQLARPHRDWQTLGIAAFSMGQMQAVLDQMESLRRQNPDTEAFFNATIKNEPFFVKNLENVQGDERDVIFISVGYGRDKDGQVSMNFGPLNKQGGERRLNVLISRARLRCEVFTNLLPDNIDLSRTSARGVEAFRTFLAYARSTESSLGPIDVHASHEPTTPFEREVLTVLRESGYQVVGQVGCAGYFIDMAVVDPERPGRYLLGIECDGPNYQSARSARDRDRLRAEVLAAMGWQLHRIWSTDWVHRYDDEVAKLKAVVAAAIEASLAPPTDGTPEAPEPDSETATTDTLTSPADSEATDGDGLAAPTAAPVIQRAAEPTVQHLSLFGIAAVPYRVADLSGMNQIALDSNDQIGTIAEIVSRVVAAESPVHWQEVSRRVAGVLGVGRLTEAFHNKVRLAAARVERAGQIQKRDDFFWTPDMQEPLLRTRAALDSRFRNIDLVAREEIALAVRQAVTESYGMASDNVARAACRLLGFERVNVETKERVDAVVRELVDAGLLAEANGTIATV